MCRFVLLILFLSGCQWFSKSQQEAPNLISPALRQVSASLSKAHAIYRRQQIQNLDYQFELDLTSEKYYSGKIKIKLQIKEPVDLTLDFTGGEVDGFKINGFSKKVDYNSYFIKLHKEDLSSGSNLIEFQYRHSYGSETGLIRFEDPKDHKVYIYSDFDIYGANQIWPCFDQPDLLATIELIVKTPKDWQVTSSSPQGGVDYSGGNFYWLFPRTPKINIQQFSMAAGFFRIWERNINTLNHNLLLRLFVRQSVADKVPVEEFFLATKNGFIFYEKELDKPFILSKYDQVLVPGGVRAPLSGFALVFFNEKDFLLNKEKSYQQTRNFTHLILNKMAQWWIGQNIVPATWEDLWISQSFSSFMAYEALQRGTLFADVNRWLIEKKYLLSEQNSISGVFFWRQLRDNSDAFLLQLRRLITKFSLNSLSSEQFFAFWKENGKYDIKPLANSIQNGAASFQLSYDCLGKKSKNIVLKKTSLNDLQSYKNIELVAYRFDGPRIVEMKSVKVDINSKEEIVPEFVGLSCSRLAFVLVDPHSRHFFKWKIDLRSLLHLKTHLREIEDENIRFYAWVLLKNAVTVKDLSGLEFLDIVEKNLLPLESFDGARIALLTSAEILQTQESFVQKLWRTKFSQKENEFAQSKVSLDIKKLFKIF